MVRKPEINIFIPNIVLDEFFAVLVGDDDDEEDDEPNLLEWLLELQQLDGEKVPAPFLGAS